MKTLILILMVVFVSNAHATGCEVRSECYQDCVFGMSRGDFNPSVQMQCRNVCTVCQ